MPGPPVAELFAKDLRSLGLPGLSALPQEAGPPTFSGTSRRLLEAKLKWPPLLARLLRVWHLPMELRKMNIVKIDFVFYPFLIEHFA